MSLTIQSVARICAISLASAAFATSIAQTNVAASVNGGVGSQSSVWATQGSPEKGNDGNRDGRWESASVMHTNFEQGAWYRVDFASASTVSQVNVFNRTDSFMGRLSPFTVTLSLSGNTVWSATNQTFGQNINDGNPFASGMSFNTGSVLADSVKVQLDGAQYLHLAELEALEAVPEPATVIAFGTGIALLARRRRGQKLAG